MKGHQKASGDAFSKSLKAPPFSFLAVKTGFQTAARPLIKGKGNPSMRQR